jgi:hypothetical protein
MSIGTEYVDVARFLPHDRAELVSASFACPWCLALSRLGEVEERPDE